MNENYNDEIIEIEKEYEYKQALLRKLLSFKDKIIKNVLFNRIFLVNEDIDINLIEMIMPIDCTKYNELTINILQSMIIKCEISLKGLYYKLKN